MKVMFFDIATDGLEIHSRIAAISIRVGGNTRTRISREFGGDDELQNMLSLAWKTIYSYNTSGKLLVGYGVTGFDIPVMAFWSMTLGVIPPLPVPQLHVLDLMRVMSFGKMAKFSSLRDVAILATGVDVKPWSDDILNSPEEIKAWQEQKLAAIEALFGKMNKVYFNFSQEDENDEIYS